MVMRFTSTSVASLLRGAAATVRLAGSAKPGTLHRVRAALRRALHSANTIKPPLLEHTLPHVPGSGRAAARVHHLSHSSPSHPLGPFGGAFRTGGYRPASRAPRGAALPAHVGLGSARTFATAPAAGSVHSAVGNVPVVLRAFTQVFDDDDKFPRPLPRGRRYIPYSRESRRTAPRARQIRKTRRSPSSTASIAEQLATYFPLRPTDVLLPPLPEDLVTPGMSATLALPLSPSLEAMLAPTPRTGYADAEVGVSILARLTHGVLPLHDAYASYASSRVIPLLARLEALGLLARHAWPATKLVLVCDNGTPDILRIVFTDRSAGDVLALLGDQLDDGWFALTDEYRDDGLSPAEEAAITEAEHWENARPAPTVRTASTMSTATATMPPLSPALTLVMPTLDMSTPTLNQEEPTWFESSRASFPPSSVASGASTPSVLDSWATSPSLSRSLSFLDSLNLDSFAARSDSSSDGWSVSPSDEDELIEAENGRISAVDVGVAEVVVSWVGPGLSLIDSW